MIVEMYVDVSPTDFATGESFMTAYRWPASVASQQVPMGCKRVRFRVAIPDDLWPADADVGEVMAEAV